MDISPFVVLTGRRSSELLSKLGVMGVQPLEMFQQKAEDYIPTQPTGPRKVSSLRYFAADHDLWIAVLEEICPDCTNQQERTAQLLAWIEHQIQEKGGVAPREAEN